MAIATREKIIETTALILVEKGFEHLTMEELSLNLAISRKTLYNHFENKEQLYELAFAYDVKKIEDGLSEIISSPLSFEDKISATILYGYEQIALRAKIQSDSFSGKIPFDIVRKYRIDLFSAIENVIRYFVNEVENLKLKCTNISNEELVNIYLMMVEGNIFFDKRLDFAHKKNLFMDSIKLLLKGTLHFEGK